MQLFVVLCRMRWCCLSLQKYISSDECSCFWLSVGAEEDDEVEVEEGSISRPVSKTKADGEKTEDKAELPADAVKDNAASKTLGQYFKLLNFLSHPSGTINDAPAKSLLVGSSIFLLS